MNSSIQKFDIGMMMEEKLQELIDVRGMSREAAMRLIEQAIQEWRAPDATDDQQPVKHGVTMKAYVNLKTHRISREPEREPEAYECQFEDVTQAAIYVASLERPMLERMRAGKLGE